MRVFNKGVKPIVYSRGYGGNLVIQPKKFIVFGDDEAKKVIAKFEDAISEKDFEDLHKKEKKVK